MQPFWTNQIYMPHLSSGKDYGHGIFTLSNFTLHVTLSLTSTLCLTHIDVKLQEFDYYSSSSSSRCILTLPPVTHSIHPLSSAALNICADYLGLFDLQVLNTNDRYKQFLVIR